MLGMDLPPGTEIRLTGKRVTRKQAAEIIYRTMGSLVFSTNLHKLGVSLTCTLMGNSRWANMVQNMTEYVRLWVEIEEVDGQLRKLEETAKINDNWRRMEDRQKEIGLLPGLKHMRNTKLLSNHIYGPRGWVDWDGTVGMTDYRLDGKCKVGQLKSELDAIASAFPHLEMQVQFLPRDHDGNATAVEPLAQIDVIDGEAAIVPPGDAMQGPGDDEQNFIGIIENLGNAYREIGFEAKDINLVLECIREHVGENA